MRLHLPRDEKATDLIVVDALRKKTPGERVAMILDAHEMARQLARAGIQFHHPDWTKSRVQREVARRMLGDSG